MDLRRKEINTTTTQTVFAIKSLAYKDNLWNSLKCETLVIGWFTALVTEWDFRRNNDTIQRINDFMLIISLTSSTIFKRM